MPVQRRLINFGIGATAFCLLVGGAVLADHDASDTQAGKGAEQGCRRRTGPPPSAPI